MLRNIVEGKPHAILVNIPKPTAKKLKLIAVEQDKSLQRLIRDILEEYISGVNKDAEKQKK